jgi:hypothetical protein
MRFFPVVLCFLVLSGCDAPTPNSILVAPPLGGVPKIPLDAEVLPTQKPILPPLPVISPSPLGTSLPNPLPAIAASGWVAWLRAVGRVSQVVVLETSNLERVTTRAMPAWEGPVLPHISADGHFMTYLTHDALTPRVVLWNLKADQEVSLAQPLPIDAREPDLSGDGHWVVYLIGEAWAPQIEMYNCHNASARVLKIPAVQLINVSAPTLSGDGNTLAYVADSQQGDSNIYLWDLAHDRPLSPPTLNSSTDDTDPSLSANGRELLFSSNRNGKFSLFAYDLKTSQYLDMSAFETANDDTNPRFWGPSDQGFSFIDTAAGLSNLRVFTF